MSQGIIKRAMWKEKNKPKGPVPVPMILQPTQPGLSPTQRMSAARGADLAIPTNPGPGLNVA